MSRVRAGNRSTFVVLTDGASARRGTDMIAY